MLKKCKVFGRQFCRTGYHLEENVSKEDVGAHVGNHLRIPMYPLPLPSRVGPRASPLSAVHRQVFSTNLKQVPVKCPVNNC